MASHYGAKGTHTRIVNNYYWTGMRKYITDYVKNCPDCLKYKTSNQKSLGRLQTPVPAQRFETLAIDLFGSLPEQWRNVHPRTAEEAQSKTDAINVEFHKISFAIF
ncbi:transposon Tf2-6 polyprotein [Trichonephila clavipes]|nr:transposon Tf2-6 polyprotein [Trichonephila clavipes]